MPGEQLDGIGRKRHRFKLDRHKRAVPGVRRHGGGVPAVIAGNDVDRIGGRVEFDRGVCAAFRGSDRALGDELGTRLVRVHGDPCGVMLVMHRYGGSSAGYVPCRDHGSGRIHRHGQADLGALVLLGSEAGVVKIVIEEENEVRPFFEPVGSPARKAAADAVGAVYEHGVGVAVVVIPCLRRIGKIHVEIHLAGVLVIDPDPALARVPDKVVGELVDPVVTAVAVGGYGAAVAQPIGAGDVRIRAEEHVLGAVDECADRRLIGVDVVIVDTLYLVDIGAAVEHGRFVPVPVEGKIRHDEIHVAVKHDFAVDIDAVREARIKIRLYRLLERQRERDALRAVCGYGHGSIARDRDVVLNAPCRAGEHRNGLPVDGGGRRSFCEHGGRNGIGERLAAVIHNVEGKGVNAGLVGVVAQLELGAGASVDGYVRLGRDRAGDIDDAGALRAGRGLRYGDRGAHEQAVHHLGLFPAGKVREGGGDVIRQQRHAPRDMGGAHRRAGIRPVARGGAGKIRVRRGIDVVAGSGDVGLYLKIRRGAVA